MSSLTLQVTETYWLTRMFRRYEAILFALRLIYTLVIALLEIENIAHTRHPHFCVESFDIYCKETVEILDLLFVVERILLTGIPVFSYELVPKFS